MIIFREPDPVNAFQLPRDLSTHGEHVDSLYAWIFWISVVLFVVVVAPMIWFAWKYRERPGHKATPTGHHPILEIVWTVTPIPLLVVLFHLGFVGYMKLSLAPSNAIIVRVKASQWAWQFEYPNGETDDKLHVPVGKPVKLVMSSADVLHAFYVPELRAKRDVVPGMYTSMWFQAKELDPAPDEGKACKRDLDCGDNGQGEMCDTSAAGADGVGKCVAALDLFCAEYCGGKSKDANGGELNPAIDREGQGDGFKGHFSMHAMVRIESPDAFAAYLKALEGGPNVTPEQRGQKIYAKKTCITCHSVDGSKSTGPSWKGIWGKTESFDEASSAPSRTVDENYVRDSVLDPNKDIVKGYTRPSQMPARLITDPKDIDAVIAYVKTLK
jgi:cytochrome c oxidase subunit 2